VVTKNTLKL